MCIWETIKTKHSLSTSALTQALRPWIEKAERAEHDQFHLSHHSENCPEGEDRAEAGKPELHADSRGI
jgi:hypothetical protein